MGGQTVSPCTGTSSAVTFDMKVTASTVTSCKIPTGTGSSVQDTGRRRRVDTPTQDQWKYTVDYPVAPALTANSNALLNARLHASNKEADPSSLKQNAILNLNVGCQSPRDRKSWQQLNTPKCDTKTFYAVPQCKAACESMNKCNTFKAMQCNDKPTKNCDSRTAANRGASAAGRAVMLPGVAMALLPCALLALYK